MDEKLEEDFTVEDTETEVALDEVEVAENKLLLVLAAEAVLAVEIPRSNSGAVVLIGSGLIGSDFLGLVTEGERVMTSKTPFAFLMW